MRRIPASGGGAPARSRSTAASAARASGASSSIASARRAGPRSVPSRAAGDDLLREAVQVARREKATVERPLEVLHQKVPGSSSEAPETKKPATAPARRRIGAASVRWLARSSSNVSATGMRPPRRRAAAADCSADGGTIA